ncbi:MAG: ketoacyl-ACP synthase III [Candidatus Polarisedimenticolaceae bacterium]|nr:ketoacyl-ACP synthase III [Candidatus Polarisedimenticolaceae bacterium]
MINAIEIIGTGSYLPEKRETVEDFLKKGASQELINDWGVFEHRVMGDDETVIDMETKAALKAIESAGIRADEIDLIISGTAVPEQTGVANSNALQQRINATNAAAFDISMACASGIPQIITAAQFISSKQYKYILVTGSSHSTRFADPTDPASFIVLGDAAGALIIQLSKSGSGILSFDMKTEGKYFDYCGFKVKQPLKPDDNHFKEELYFYIGDVSATEGVTRYLLKSVPETVNKALDSIQLSTSDIDFLIIHQNINTLSGRWIEKLKVPKEKVYITNEKYGNMTSANIFVNLDEAVRANKIKKGSVVVLAGQGAGFSVGSIVMKW